MTLSIADARDLEDFFSRSGFALRSIQGPIQDRLILLSYDGPKSKEPLTARPSSRANHGEEPRSEPNEADLEVFGRVSRKLSMLSARHRATLELYYGDAGAVASINAKKAGGRIVALFPLTAAGRALVKRERLAQGGKVRLKQSNAEVLQKAVERYEKAAAGDPAAPGDELTVSIGAARVQAERLRDQAEEAYTAASQRLNLERKNPAYPKAFIREEFDERDL